jgi:hypothetical protein
MQPRPENCRRRCCHIDAHGGDACRAGHLIRTRTNHNWRDSQLWSAGVAVLRAAAVPWAWLHLDARVLGLGPCVRILLGSGHVGAAAIHRRAVDSAGYWDYDNGVYVWYAGYWGPAVGYYGGIDYGYGYTGDGYHGGYWNHGAFYYNRTVNTITTVNITSVYNQSVDEHFRDRHISYHGGRAEHEEAQRPPSCLRPVNAVRRPSARNNARCCWQKLTPLNAPA